MIFRIQATDITEAFINDGFLQDDVEMLPGGWSIPYRQVKKYREKKPFYVFDPDGKKTEIENSDEIIDGFNYYYVVWENCKDFGLPHGGGWKDYPAWLPDFLKFYNRVFQEIETYRFDRRRNG